MSTEPKSFYHVRLGWRLDADLNLEDGYRVVQVTPPGPGCSLILGEDDILVIRARRNNPGSAISVPTGRARGICWLDDHDSR